MKFLTLLLALFAFSASASERICEASIYFDTAKATLTNEAKARLDVFIDCLHLERDGKLARVTVSGFADPRKYDNQKLSDDRAMAVRNYLVSNSIPAEVIGVVGKSDKAPVCTEKTRECLAKNRRVDVYAVAVQVQVVPVPVPVEKVVEKVVEYCPPPPPSNWHYGPFVKLGGGKEHPDQFAPDYNKWYEGDVGFGFHYRPWRLGGQVYLTSDLVVGGQGMFYILQGEGLEWHLDLGVGWVGGSSDYPSVNDVPRKWDFQTGTGLEYPLTKHLVLTGDLRWSLPFMWQASEYGWTMNKNTVVSNSLVETRVFAGLQYRF